MIVIDDDTSAMMRKYFEEVILTEHWEQGGFGEDFDDFDEVLAALRDPSRDLVKDIINPDLPMELDNTSFWAALFYRKLFVLGPPTVVIELKKRVDDWHSQIEGEPGRWSAGRSPGDALGSLVMAHRDQFPTIEYKQVK